MSLEDRRIAKLEAAIAAHVAEREGTTTAAEPPTLIDFAGALSIVDKARSDSGLVQWELWPAQADALQTFADESHVFWVKARQIGATTCALAFALHGTCYWPHREALIIRTSQVEANDGIRRCKQMWESIPPELNPPRIVLANASRVEFDNGSRVVALPATEKVARGHAAWLLICDEFCFWEYEEEQLNAAAPSASRVLIVTTGNGPTGFAYRLWKAACAGTSQYVPVFKPWTADPRRDEAWYRRVVEQSITPRLAKREYPTVAEDCWTAPSGLFFERWNPARNVADLEPVPDWTTVRCIDWGITTAACVWIQAQPSTHQLFVIGELVTHDLTTAEFCRSILEREEAFGLATPPQVSWCDPAGQGRSTQTGTAEFEVARGFGLYPVAADNNQHDGCVRILNAIAAPEYPLVVARSCPGLIEAFSTIRPDKGRSDIYDDAAPGDATHLLDSLRYGLSRADSFAGDPWTPPDPSAPVSAPFSGGFDGFLRALHLTGPR